MFYPVQTTRRAALAIALCAAPTLAQAAPSLSVPFALDKAARVSLVLEDARGNRVRNLTFAQPFGAGQQRVAWDGRDENGRLVAPGTYRVRVLTSDGVSLRYEFAVNTAGDPPWHTLDRTGAWMADHSPPQATLFLPRGVSPYGGGAPQILVASQVAEVGDPLVWLDLDGHKLHGGDKIGGWNGGIALCRDAGPRAAPDYYAFTLVVAGNDMGVYGIKRDGSTQRIGENFGLTDLHLDGDAERRMGFNIAAYNGVLAVSDPPRNRVYFLDVTTGKRLGAASLLAPTGLAFGDQGRFYVATEEQIRRFPSLDGFNWNETCPDHKWRNNVSETRVNFGLQAPSALTAAPDGSLYVCDGGAHHQILVYDAQGNFVRAIGREGGPQLGRYDETRMQFPSGVALDDRGQLWVGEADYVPKRLSLWKSDGAFVRAFYGPPRYGGGGTLDPTDKTRFFYAAYALGTVEFKLDWKTGSFKPTFIVWRPERGNTDAIPTAVAPETPLTVNGARYLTNNWTVGLRYNEDVRWGIWKVGADEIARPVMMFGNGDWFEHAVHGTALRDRAAIAALWAGRDGNHVLWLWSDLNGDGFVEANEVQWREMPQAAYPAILARDLSIATAHGTRIPPPTFDARGTPIYDLNKMTSIAGATPGDAPLQVGRQLLMISDNEASSLVYGDQIGGAKAWVLGTSQEPSAGVVQATRLLGLPITPRGGEAGPVVAINGEKGAIFLVTMDGYFVGTLGADERTTPLLREPNARCGALLPARSFAGEQFAPTLAQTEDGAIYLVAGHEFSAIFDVDGLNSVARRDFGALAVTAAQLQTLTPARGTERRAQTHRRWRRHNGASRNRAKRERDGCGRGRQLARCLPHRRRQCAGQRRQRPAVRF